MPRNPRSVCAGVVHHVTQRGVDRQNVFFSQQDRQVYLQLLQDNIASAAVRVLAYCLMNNHVHCVVIPERPDSLALLFQRVHGRYAQYLNARRRRTGHLWQNRFFSCAVARDREPWVLRYVEANPVRAGIVEAADAYHWSSAAAHLAGPGSEAVPLLDWNDWTSRGGAPWWRQWIHIDQTIRDVDAIRQATYSGAPLGPLDFVQSMEQRFGRQWRRPGRPPRKQAGRAMASDASGTISVA